MDMKALTPRTFAIVVLALVVVSPALAHHSVAGVFDISKPMTVTGVVEKVDWINPHIAIYLGVTDAKGVKTTWTLETFPPAFFKRANVSRTAIPVGEKLTAEGFPGKEAPTRVWPMKLTFYDGKVLQLEKEDKR